MGEKQEAKIDPKIIKKTQETLGKIIKKPPFTDKLLSKPPFRFLHDIITSVIKTSGFMRGLYTETELNSDNVKDRDAKVSFLQKAIDIVSLVIGRPLSVKPSKIITGHDAEKTNELLQCLAEAIKKKVDNDDYVKQVLSGDNKPPSGTKREKSSDRPKRDREDDSKPSAEKSQDASREKTKDSESGKERHRERREKSEDRRDKDRERREKKEGERKEGDRKEGERDRQRSRPKDGESDRERRRSKRREEPKQEEAVTAETEAEEPPPRLPRPTSAKGSRRRHSQGAPGDSSDEDDDTIRQQERTATKQQSDPSTRRLSRPSSARPAAPRIKKTSPEETQHNIGVSNVPNLIRERAGESDSDEETFVREEEEDEVHTAALTDPQLDDTEHGGLVKKMLETKKEFDGGSQQQTGRKTEIERSAVDTATRRKERELVEREIGKLRSSIQALTRSVHPLGKILDFVQEDLDAMQAEREMWKRENKQNALALQREQSVTASCIEPLHCQLTEIDSAISDQLDLIAAVKSSILKNDEKLEKMLGSITKS